MKPLRPVADEWPMIQGWMENPLDYPKNGGHKGWDFSCPVETEDIASLHGLIEYIGYRPTSGYGREIVLRVNEHLTIVYGHHSKYLCQIGDRVIRGQVIDLTGGDPYDSDLIDGYSSGPHLHFEPRWDNVPFDPSVFFAMDFTDAGETAQPENTGESVIVATDYINLRIKPDRNSYSPGIVKNGMELKIAGSIMPGSGNVKGWRPVVFYVATGVDGDDPYLI